MKLRTALMLITIIILISISKPVAVKSSNVQEDDSQISSAQIIQDENTPNSNAQVGGEQYVMWADSSSCSWAVELGGSATITGDIHSNGSMKASGGGSILNIMGNGSYVTALSNNATWIPAVNNPQQVTAQANDPLEFNFTDYAPGGVKWQQAVDDPNAVAVSYPCDGADDTMYEDWLIDEGYVHNGVIDDGLYYVACNITFIKPPRSNATTFITEGAVTFFNSAKPDLHAYLDGLLFFSNQQLPAGSECSSATAPIRITGSPITLEGILYAPYGRIRISGSNLELDGAIIGDSISLAGSNSEINYKDFGNNPVLVSLRGRLKSQEVLVCRRAKRRTKRCTIVA